jgi:hypothetical protein
MINYNILNGSCRRLLETSNIDRLTEMKILTNKSGRFTKEDYQQYQELIETIKTTTLISESNLIEEQPLLIIDTFKMETGHWFVCRNNHVYNINEVRFLQIKNKIYLLF